MGNYSTKSTSLFTADVEDIVISETKTTRKVLRAQLVENNPKNRKASVRMAIVHQRRSKSTEWEDIQGKELTKIKAGDAMKIQLNSEETFKVNEHLSKLYQVVEKKGVSSGTNQYMVGDQKNTIVVDEKRASIINEIVSEGYSGEFWDTLKEASPDLATKLSHAKIQQDRLIALEKYEELLGGDAGENEWQVFFESNTWIFGYGLNYVFLKTVSSQPSYGGKNIHGKGENRGDFLAASTGINRFTVLVEIKKPMSQLLKSKKYRNSCFEIGEHLIGGVSQLRANALEWETEGAMSSANRDELEDNSIYTVQPRKILIIGNTDQLKGRDQRNTFELFRRNQKDVEIITFDELFQRAKYIINHE